MRLVQAATTALTIPLLVLSTACTPGSVLPKDKATPIAGEPIGIVAQSARVQPPSPSDYSQYVANPAKKDSFSVTFGFLLCSLTDDAKIVSVKPLESVGSGFRVESTRLATFRAASGITVASPGNPPAGREGEQLGPIVGASPRTCKDEELLSEVQIGVRKTSDDGGGWRGAIVEYEVGDRRYSLEIPLGMLVCGTSTELC